MKPIVRVVRRLWTAGRFSPEAFVVRAVVVAMLYAVSRGVGLQEYTAFLSGTSPAGNVSWQTAAFLGLVHLLLHVAFLLLVPISLITAALLASWNWWRRDRES